MIRNIIITFLLLTSCSLADSPFDPKNDNINSSKSVVGEYKDFNECAKDGNIILKSFPPKCISKSGKEYVHTVKRKNQSACKNLCGDGICQEIVCMAIGCPCPESKTICPADCK